MMIGGRKLFIDLYISINNVCMLFSGRFHELSFHSKSSNLHLRFHTKGVDYICILFYLFYLLIFYSFYLNFIH